MACTKLIKQKVETKNDSEMIYLCHKGVLNFWIYIWKQKTKPEIRLGTRMFACSCELPEFFNDFNMILNFFNSLFFMCAPRLGTHACLVVYYVKVIDDDTKSMLALIGFRLCWRSGGKIWTNYPSAHSRIPFRWIFSRWLLLRWIN
jgi:hypothetical protein